jgi:DNA gyrase subunit A
VKTINITSKTGSLIAIKEVSDTDDLIIINKSGILIRLGVKDLRVMGRATQGVRLINLRDEDAIASVAKVEVDESQDEGEDFENELEEETFNGDETV